MTSLNVLFSFVVSLDLEVHQMDLCTTFFNCTLQEEILMQQPQGLHTKSLEIKHVIFCVLYMV